MWALLLPCVCPTRASHGGSHSSTPAWDPSNLLVATWASTLDSELPS